jgi:hypothetical protein
MGIKRYGVMLYTMPMKEQNSIGLAGVHTFRTYLPKTEADHKLLQGLERAYATGKGATFREKCAHMMQKCTTVKNLTTTAGREWLCQILCNTSPRVNNYITHFAIGDDTTPAAEGNTALGNEVFRKAVSSWAEDGATANISVFIAANEANFEWEEWGHFVDATSTAGSGVMFSHKIDSTVSKSSPTTITVDSVFTLSNA